MRLLRELVEDTAEECEGRAAVAVRLCVDEMVGSHGFIRDDIDGVVGELACYPTCGSSWSATGPTIPRLPFAIEGSHSEHLRGLKQLTTKPVVGVGRFTGPDMMVDQIRSGTTDFIGAAAALDCGPVSSRQIESGLIDDIRECIGCNICVSGDYTMSPIRCTQNPTMGEEWRRGWHPEYVPPAQRPEPVLVVGAGPAGLEIARTLGHRDCSVALLEAGRELGGRVRRESALPGLSAWIRVVDYREQQLGKLDSVEIHRQSPVSVDDVLDFGFAHVVVSTGATWRADGVGRWNHHPVPIADGADVLTPDDIMSGARPSGSRVVIFDDDHYYMAGILAELLANEGFAITVVCPKPQVSAWTSNTLEVDRIQARLINAGVALHNNQALVAVDGDAVTVHVRTPVPSRCLLQIPSCWSPPASPTTTSIKGWKPELANGTALECIPFAGSATPMRPRPLLPRCTPGTRPGVSSNVPTLTRLWRSGAKSPGYRTTSRYVDDGRQYGCEYSLGGGSGVPTGTQTVLMILSAIVWRLSSHSGSR